MTAPLNSNKHIEDNLIEMVREKLLLERVSLNGIDVNRRDKAGKNALYWAIKRKSTHNANLLISFESSLMVTKKEHALFHAIKSKHYEVVVLLINRGLSVDMEDHNGKTLLMYAIESEVFETVKFLVTRGANIYLLDNELNMAEDYAKKCQSDMIKTYLKHSVYRDMHQ